MLVGVERETARRRLVWRERQRGGGWGVGRAARRRHREGRCHLKPCPSPQRTNSMAVLCCAPVVRDGAAASRGRLQECRPATPASEMRVRVGCRSRGLLGWTRAHERASRSRSSASRPTSACTCTRGWLSTLWHAMRTPRAACCMRRLCVAASG
eukprot:366018-Chlamydomonas_euryale.AAC.10